MARIQDIARGAGVSVGTVSNYLNDPQVVAEETREKIKAKIEELGYHPRAAARSLRSRRTSRIGLVPVISLEDNRSLEPGDAAFLEFLAGINTVAAEHRYGLLMAAAPSPATELEIYERLVGEAQVDGFAVLGVRPADERIAFLIRSGFPFVTFGRSDLISADGTLAHAFVDVDGGAGVRAAVDHLAVLGHRRIAYVSPPAGLMCTQQRWNGFAGAMAANGLEIHDAYAVPGGFQESTGRRAADELMRLSEPPTAIIAANDFCAFGVMTSLQRSGLTVGREVSVVGFDDIGPASHWRPPLTSVAQPFRRIGMEVMEGLLALLDRDSPDRPPMPQVLIQPELIVRRSTGPAPGQD